MGFFEDVLEGFFTIVGWIVEGIRKILQAIAAVVTWIGQNVLPVLALIITGIGLLIAVIAIFAPGVAATIITFITTKIPLVLSGIRNLLVGGAKSLVHQAKVIQSLVATVLDFVHFDVILQIHEVAWIFSEQYRKVMSKLFMKISKVSEKVLGYSLALQMILNTTRNIVIGSTTAIGIDYTGSQMVWLETMADFFSRFNEKVTDYKENPQNLFLDLEEWIDENKVDLTGSLHAAQWEFIEGLSQQAVDQANQMQVMENNLNFGLGRITDIENKHYDVQIDLFRHGFDGFVRDDYAPTVQQQNRAIESNRGNMEANRIHIDGINFKLNRPGDVMEDADALPEPDRSEQLEKMQDMSTKPYQENTNELTNEQQVSDEAREEQLETEEEQEATPEAVIPDPAPVEPEIEPIKPADKSSWNVGDY